MVKIYKQPFAHDGDTIVIPDASQPDGKMSSADGWTPDYQLPKTDPNYKPVGRQEMNGVFKEVTEALGQVQVQGSATWSADGAPYPINAQVYHSGKQWLALSANSVAPVEGADWSAIITDRQLATKAALSHTHPWDQVNDKPVTATRWPTFGEVTDKPTSHIPIGVVQTWQNVTGLRSPGTIYTNTTGRTIAVSARGRPVTSGGGNVSLYIDGNTVMFYDSGGVGGLNSYPHYSVFGIIPPGSNYTVSASAGLTSWWELRA